MIETAWDVAQWFEALGTCRCGKPGTGHLRGYSGNENLGIYCRSCAERRIKAAHKRKQFEPDCVLEYREHTKQAKGAGAALKSA